jgi:hypothetical protein
MQNKILANNSIFKSEDNVPAGKLKKKIWKKIIFLFCILKVTEERSRTRSWIRILIRILIRTKNVTVPLTCCTLPLQLMRDRTGAEVGYKIGNPVNLPSDGSAPPALPQEWI